MRERPRLLGYLLNRLLLEIRRKKMMVPGRRRHSRKEEGIPVISADVREGNRREKHDSVQIDFVPLLQNSGEFGGTSRSVALADQILRGIPALIPGGVLVNEVGKVIGILDDAMKLCRK
jgi:hypothetical protein